MFALKRTSLGSVLDCVAPCLEESLLSLAKLRLEEVWKSFTEHTKRVDVWPKNDSEKRSVIFLRSFHMEWAVAWSLVGEWTIRTIFLPPKGEWPRQGHPKALISPRSFVTLCISPLAKPVVFIWFTPRGLAPLSLRPFAWSFRVSTLCCLMAIVYQSRSLRLKICGKKLSDCSIAGFRVRFQPAVVLGV